MVLPQTYKCIKTMGPEKSCNRNRERKGTNSKREEFQHAVTKYHKSEVCILRRYRMQDEWLYWSERFRDPVKRRQIVSSKNLCFNCLYCGHSAADWPSHICFKCNQKYHAHRASTTNYKTTPATEIKRQERRWRLPFEKKAFAALLRFSAQMEFSVES